MAACSFVKTAVNQDKPLLTEESLQTTRDDVNTIENALKFVNDLLRSMLDMHRLVFDAEAVHYSPRLIFTHVLCFFILKKGNEQTTQNEVCPN